MMGVAAAEAEPVAWPDFIQPVDRSDGLFPFDLWSAKPSGDVMFDLLRGARYADEALRLGHEMNDGAGDPEFLAGVLRAITEKNQFGALELAFLDRIARAAHVGARN